MGQIIYDPGDYPDWLEGAIASEMAAIRALADAPSIKTGIIAEYRGWYDIRFAPRFSRVTKTNGMTLDDRKGRPGGHAGIDIFAPLGSSVKAIAYGPAWVVSNPNSTAGFGNAFWTQFQHAGQEYRMAYGHLDVLDPDVLAAIEAKASENKIYRVEIGTVIGTAGCRGNASTLPNCIAPTKYGKLEQHVHIEVRKVSSGTWPNWDLVDAEKLFDMRLRYTNEERVFVPNAQDDFQPKDDSQLLIESSRLW